jgi:predicted nucleic-acid-binding Zn-ribbon protein
MVDDVEEPTAQFGYARCGNCGYSMFFDAAITELWFIDPSRRRS